ncbi:M15 family metallopeptidase [Peribacillus simplex]|uniref:M15 family metallopeptidase n=2 Tax=Peribacillus TaxID=2675229 RepID=A0AA90SKS5_9BACI|nr:MULTISPECIES: M15 family metallopeptidase [Peribacillus]MDP1419221.1 M15 family metallopeptidase [Peribacillus simplex]MDP1452141.1 M15 family metallopeptidase [Peribacillus frigoritolerans]
MVNLNELNPYVEKQAKLLEVNANKRLTKYKMKITHGFRSFAEQNAIYAQGRTKKGSIVTNAKGGQSMHNYGLAIDFCLITPDGKKAVWDTYTDFDKDGLSDWKEVVEEAKKLGFEWGGDWKSFKDSPHFQMTCGLTLKDLQNGKRPVFKDVEVKSGDSKQNVGKATTKPKAPVKTAPVKSVSLPNGVYKEGDRGTAVKQIQEALNTLNFKCGKVDGQWGKATTSAMKRFQSVYCNPVDGVYGNKSRAAMLKQLNKK